MHPVALVCGLSVVGALLKGNSQPGAKRRSMGYSAQHRHRISGMQALPPRDFDTEPLVHAFAKEMAENADEYGEAHDYSDKECAAIYLHTYRSLGGYRRAQIMNCQHELGLPETGVYCERTVNTVAAILARALEERASDEDEMQLPPEKKRGAMQG